MKESILDVLLYLFEHYFANDIALVPGNAPVSYTHLDVYKRQVQSVDSLPYVVGLEDNRLRATRGQVAYIRGLEGVAAGQRYIVVRAEKRYRAPADSSRDQAIDLDARGNHMRLAEFNDCLLYTSRCV